MCLLWQIFYAIHHRLTKLNRFNAERNKSSSLRKKSIVFGHKINGRFLGAFPFAIDLPERMFWWRTQMPGAHVKTLKCPEKCRIDPSNFEKIHQKRPPLSLKRKNALDCRISFWSAAIHPTHNTQDVNFEMKSPRWLSLSIAIYFLSPVDF